MSIPSLHSLVLRCQYIPTSYHPFYPCLLLDEKSSAALFHPFLVNGRLFPEASGEGGREQTMFDHPGFEISDALCIHRDSAVSYENIKPTNTRYVYVCLPIIVGVAHRRTPRTPKDGPTPLQTGRERPSVSAFDSPEVLDRTVSRLGSVKPSQPSSA